MAEPLEPQARLDHIVEEIARNMVAEVCSIYVLRADAVLELYATEGLNPSVRAPGAAASRAGSRRHDRGERRAAQPFERAGAPRLRLSAGNGRGDLQFLPRRADPAGRSHARRADRPEPHHAHLSRGRGGGARDDGDGACRDDRVRRPDSARTGRASNSISESP